MAKHKGFRTGTAPERVATITFEEGHALHGIEIEVGMRVPVGVVLASDRNVLGVGVAEMVKKIRSWNLVDDADQPVPVSEEGFRAQFDVMEAADLVRAWLEEMTTPSAPLEQP